MRRWKPVDFVVMLLTIGIFLILIFPMVARYFKPEINMSEGGLSALIQIVVALIAVISVYVGYSLNGRKH
jgi:hypothetical protein